MMKKRLILFSAFLLFFCLALGTGIFGASAKEKEYGSKNNPYRIETKEDLLAFALSVNEGRNYEGEYLLQTADIDLAGVDWPTIGLFGSEYAFLGTYNGGGHVILNLTVNVGGNNALFGQLGGTVMNLGIESGTITGACLGGITSHSSRVSAQIINCYNKATVKGARVGGIADNFNGTISNCWSECELLADSPENIGGIVSFGAFSLNNCISIEPEKRGSAVLQGTTVVDRADADLEEIVRQLNQNLYSTAIAAEIDYHDLCTWKVSEDGQSIVFSSETARFQAKYAGAFFKVYLVEALPYLLLLLGCACVILVCRKATAKKQMDT